MKQVINSNNLIRAAAEHLGVTVKSTSALPQGMDSTTVAFADKEGDEFVIKYSDEVKRDKSALELISEHSELNIPIPTVVGSFLYEGTTALIMKRIPYPLLQEVAAEQFPKYVNQILQVADLIHQIKSANRSFKDIQENLNWKESLAYALSGNHPDHQWDEIATRPHINPDLLKSLLNKLNEELTELTLPASNYSFIHTDYNQRNIFIDPDSDMVTGLIDWSEAQFGDRLFDFARIRILIWHFELPQETLNHYWKFLELEENESKLEDFYFRYQLFTYLTWYSEDQSDFAIKRIERHQDYLSKWLTRV